MPVFLLSTNNGSHRRRKRRPKPCEQRQWLEADLEHALALCPQALGIEGALPIMLDGGSTATQPDQLHLGRDGRCTVVEIKSGRAGVDGLMQLLAYGEHWRALPIGELQICARSLLTSAGLGIRSHEALKALRRWAGEKGTARAVMPFSQLRVLKPGETVTDYARKLWTGPVWRLAGMPPRSILAAPDFSDEVRRLAGWLTERGTSVELVRAGLATTKKGEVALEWEPDHVSPDIERTWQFASMLMDDGFIAENFALNGWSDQLAKLSFSLSAKSAPEVKLWIEVAADDARTLGVSTALPDNWLTPYRRRKLRERLLKASPTADDVDRWIYWWMNEQDASGLGLVATATQVARALQEIVVPEAIKR